MLSSSDTKQAKTHLVVTSLGTFELEEYDKIDSNGWRLILKAKTNIDLLSD
jgi:hypothetical protein